MIKSFTCKNFRNINIEDIELEHINLLIGPNNSGKSNFIDAITFLSDMLYMNGENGLRSSFLNLIQKYHWDHMRTCTTDARTPIEFEWTMDLGKELVQYCFHFLVGDNAADCNIVRESLESAFPTGEGNDHPYNYFSFHDISVGFGAFSSAAKKKTKNKRIKVGADSKDSIILQFKDILLAEKTLYEADNVRINIASLLNELESSLRGYRHYALSQFDTDEMRTPADPRAIDNHLYADASNFTNMFNKYQAVDISWKEYFFHHMKELIHDLRQIDVINEYNKLVFKMAYDGGQFDLYDVSEGTLRGLALNLLLNAPEGEAIEFLAMDEPELNLHPAWQKIVGAWVQQAANVRQCLVSTHSPDFMDAFTEGFKQGDVAVFVFDPGASIPIRKIRYDMIKDSLQDWELGDLYRTNDPALGGWPW